MNKVLRRILITVATVLVFMSGLFYVWTLFAYGPTDDAKNAMRSSDQVNISNGKYILFSPKNEVKRTGIIFYPGGKVKPEAYAPLLAKLAESGYEVIEVKMPMNLAIFNLSAAEKIIKERTDKNWIICGHSLGGAMAVSFVRSNPDSGLKGLMLWGAYPGGESYSLVDNTLPVASIYGSKDMQIDKIRDYKIYLPKETFYYEIKGGNHAQFGDYGPQKGDQIADITKEQQLEEILKGSLEFLSQFE